MMFVKMESVREAGGEENIWTWEEATGLAEWVLDSQEELCFMKKFVS
jgi:hypothetical protein